jgi:endonuclease YncB( thermonuclease family)
MRQRGRRAAPSANPAQWRPRSGWSRWRKWVAGLVGSALASVLMVWLGLPAPPFSTSPTPGTSGELQGQVTSVADGDTLTLVSPTGEHRIRLGGIDAPELDQAHGQQARAALALLCLGRTAQVSIQDQDRYGRTVGTVRCGDASATTELVRQGHAWVYTRYNHDPELPALQAQARSTRQGLWAQARPTPPWEWRQRSNQP